MSYSRELINGDSIYDFDVTKLAVNTLSTSAFAGHRGL